MYLLLLVRSCLSVMLQDTFTLLCTFLTSFHAVNSQSSSLGSSEGEKRGFSFRSAVLLQGHMVKALWLKVPADVYKSKKKNKMQSEGKEQFNVCIVWGGKLHLQSLDSLPQRTRRTQSPNLFPLMKNQSELRSTAAHVLLSQQYYSCLHQEFDCRHESHMTFSNMSRFQFLNLKFPGPFVSKRGLCGVYVQRSQGCLN